jgi:hypothetical protein
MDPTTAHNANLNLPPLQLPEVKQTLGDEQSIDLKGPNPSYGEQAAQQPGVEQAMTERRNTEMAASGQPTVPGVARPAGVGVTTPVGPGADPAQTAIPVATPMTGTMVAADSDLIEKAWVKTAKAIIDQTREDPYKQNKEITKVKAEYIKKRYNRDIKINDE